MDFKLNFELPKADFSISHQDTVLFLGSCFSDEISEKAKFSGLNVLSNPFGTVFHPSLLGSFITESIEGVNEERIVNREDVFLSWDANSSIFGFSEEELQLKLRMLRSEFLEKIAESKTIFITFGTAWVYRNIDNHQLVANCHKLSNSNFTKELSDVDVLHYEWIGVVQKIREINSGIKIVFTVSPVRHVKDGLIENNQSKSILIELVRRLTLTSGIHYFPSYEIIVDELRDYRFYKTDRVHPSEEAVEYVWRKFSSVFFNPETVALNQQILNFRKMVLHRSLHEDSIDNQLRKNQLNERLIQFLKSNPSVNWY